MTVPAECWKVLVVVPQRPAASDELAEVDAGARVIAVIMPNDELHVDSNWTAYRTSTQIERRTGYHFFDRLPPDVVDVLRRRVDQTPVAPARTRRYGDERCNDGDETNGAAMRLSPRRHYSGRTSWSRSRRRRRA